MLEMSSLDMLKDALEDEQFAHSLGSVSTESEFVALLAEKGIELTSEEASACYESFVEGESDDGELDAESLDDVSGGISWRTAIKIARALGKEAWRMAKDIAKDMMR